MLPHFERKHWGGVATPLFIALALAGSLSFAFMVVRFELACPTCLVLPSSYYLSWLMFFLILLSPIAYVAAHLKGRSNNSSSTSKHVDRSQYVLLAVAAVLVASLSVLRFLLDPIPQGSDTPNYLYVSNLIIEKQSIVVILGDGRELTFLALAALRLLVEGVFHQPFQLSVILFPILLSNIMAFATFQLVHTLTQDRELGIASMAFSGFSFFLIRMSYDLFAQMLGVSLLLLLFSSIIKTMTTNNLNRKSLIQITLLSTGLILAHSYTWILGMVILVVYMLGSYLEGVVPRLGPTLATLLPGIAYLAMIRLTSGLVHSVLPAQWYERVLATPSVVQGVLFTLQSGNFSPLNPSFLSNATVGFENPLILTAAALGAIALLRPDSRHRLPTLLFSWTLSLSVLLLFGFNQQYRLIILLPVGILAGYAATTLSRVYPRKVKLLSLNMGSYRLTRRVTSGTFIILVMILLAFSVSVPKAVAPQYVYYPNSQRVQQLLLIRDLYGFGNQRILVLVEDPGFFQNSFQYARAITGANVYQGSAYNLTMGKPFLLAGIVPVSPDLHSLDVIVIPPALYSVGPAETSVFRMENGLYMTTPNALMALTGSN